MRTARPATVALVAVTLTGCGAYRNSGGRCVFVTWDEGSGRREHPLEGADPRSFRVLARDVYASDATHVYHTRIWMKEADPRTFTVLPGSFLDRQHGAYWAKDARHVWLGDAPLTGAQPASFRPIKFPFSRDAAHVYCGTVAMAAEPATFQVLTTGDGTRSTSDSTGRTTQVVAPAWSKDAHRCFYGPAVVDSADPASFQPLGDYYAKDLAHVYYEDRVLPLADPATFTADGISGRDKARRFVAGRVPGAR